MRQTQRNSRRAIWKNGMPATLQSRVKKTGQYKKCTDPKCTDPNCDKGVICLDPNCKDPSCTRNAQHRSDLNNSKNTSSKEEKYEIPPCHKPQFSELPHEGIDVESVLKDLVQLHIKSSSSTTSTTTSTITTTTTKKKIMFDNTCRYCRHLEYFPLIRTLVLGLSEQADVDYVKYKKLVDENESRIPKSLQMSYMFECHRWATTRFGWSLISNTNAKEIINLIVSKAPKVKRIVSMGSGCGYAEHMLYNGSREMGKPFDIVAYDLFPPQERANFKVKVTVGGVDSFRALAPLDDAVLLLCWPPFGDAQNEQSRMGFDTLSLYTELGGKYFIYIGDFDATGDWRFHDLLQKEWTMYEETLKFTPMGNWIPEKMGLLNADDDSIGIYHRK